MGMTNSTHVLLTNDDGHRAPGILAMKAVLKSRGYRVSMVAPSSEQSATSMRKNVVCNDIICIGD